MEQASTSAPTVGLITDLSGLAQPNDMTVTPALFSVGDGDSEPGVFVNLETSQGSLQILLSIEQSIELQLRSEEAAHQALMVAELARPMERIVTDG